MNHDMYLCMAKVVYRCYSWFACKFQFSGQNALVLSIVTGDAYAFAEYVVIGCKIKGSRLDSGRLV